MLYVIAIIFVIIWLLGLATAYTLGGLIHVFLIVAIIAVLVQMFAGRDISHSDN